MNLSKSKPGWMLPLGIEPFNPAEHYEPVPRGPLIEDDESAPEPEITTARKWELYGAALRAESRGYTRVSFDDRSVVESNNWRDPLGGTLKTREWAALKAAFLGMCAYCGKRRVEVLEHILPISRGGRTSADNVLPSCAPCNKSKWARSVYDWSRDDRWWLDFIGRVLAAHERMTAGQGLRKQ